MARYRSGAFRTCCAQPVICYCQCQPVFIDLLGIARLLSRIVFSREAMKPVAHAHDYFVRGAREAGLRVETLFSDTENESPSATTAADASGAQPLRKLPQVRFMYELACILSVLESVSRWSPVFTCLVNACLCMRVYVSGCRRWSMTEADCWSCCV